MGVSDKKSWISIKSITICGLYKTVINSFTMSKFRSTYLIKGNLYHVTLYLVSAVYVFAQLNILPCVFQNTRRTRPQDICLAKTILIKFYWLSDCNLTSVTRIKRISVFIWSQITNKMYLFFSDWNGICNRVPCIKVLLPNHLFLDEFLN